MPRRFINGVMFLLLHGYIHVVRLTKQKPRSLMLLEVPSDKDHFFRKCTHIVSLYHPLKKKRNTNLLSDNLFKVHRAVNVHVQSELQSEGHERSQ